MRRSNSETQTEYTGENDTEKDPTKDVTDKETQTDVTHSGTAALNR